MKRFVTLISVFFLITSLSAETRKEAVQDIVRQKAGALTEDVNIPARVFVFDPGHGGYNSGIVYNNLKEKDVVMSVSRQIEALLQKKGKKVFFTRKGDQFTSLSDRIMLASQKTPDVFISLHSGLTGDFVIYIPKFPAAADNDSVLAGYDISFRQKKYIDKSRLLAEGLAKAFRDEFKGNVLLREMPLPLLNSMAAPSVLVEIPSIGSMRYDDDMRARVADSFMRGLSYFGQ